MLGDQVEGEKGEEAKEEVCASGVMNIKIQRKRDTKAWRKQ